MHHNLRQIDRIHPAVGAEKYRWSHKSPLMVTRTSPGLYKIRGIRDPTIRLPQLNLDRSIAVVKPKPAQQVSPGHSRQPSTLASNTWRVSWGSRLVANAAARLVAVRT